MMCSIGVYANEINCYINEIRIDLAGILDLHQGIFNHCNDPFDKAMLYH
jgi:hypothetical protein